MNPQRSRLCYDYRNEAVEIEPVFFSPIAPAKARPWASPFSVSREAEIAYGSVIKKIHNSEINY